MPRFVSLEIGFLEIEFLNTSANVSHRLRTHQTNTVEITICVSHFFLLRRFIVFLTKKVTKSHTLIYTVSYGVVYEIFIFILHYFHSF